MISIKLVHNGEVRRLQVNSNRSRGLDFTALDESVRNIFPDLKSAYFSLSWIDEEGDQVTVSSDPEIAEALRVFAQGTAMVRFQVNVTKVAETVKQYPVSDGVIHSHITCDECGMSPIQGLRFKCTVRDDFDLCELCESKETQPFPMIKIADSRDYHPCHSRRSGRFGRGRCGGRGFGGHFNRSHDEGSVPKVIHFKVRCDECGISPIEGPRFKCAVREDFDLCEACEALKIQPYPMIKIMNPAQAPKALVYAFHDDDNNNQQSKETRASATFVNSSVTAASDHPHYGYHHGHGIRHGMHGHGNSGRGGRGWGGFARRRGCPYMQQQPPQSQEEGGQGHRDASQTVTDRPVISSIAEALSCLKGLSGYHSVDIPNNKQQKQQTATAAPPAATTANLSKPPVVPVAVSPASAPVTVPVAVKEVKARPVTLSSVSPPRYVGLPAGVYPFPGAHDGIYHHRSQPSVEGQTHHHRRPWAYTQTSRRHPWRGEWRNRDLSDEDEALQKAIRESFGVESPSVLPSAKFVTDPEPVSLSSSEASDVSDTNSPATDDITATPNSVASAVTEATGVTVETVEEGEDEDGDDEDEGSDSGSIVLVDAVTPTADDAVEKEVEEEEERPAAVVPAPPVTTPAVTATTPAAPAKDDGAWHEELTLLAAMGFMDTAAIIPLLQRHINSADIAAGRKTEGLQRVVAELLNV